MWWALGVAGWVVLAGTLGRLAWRLRRQGLALAVLQKRVALLNRAAVHAAEDRAKRRALEQETVRMTAEEIEEAREKGRPL